jgi:hypothetical protein
MYPKSLAIDAAMSGNWIFTATRAAAPVGESAAASVAVWTCPMEAAAKGTRSNDVNALAQSSPRDLVRTF